MNSDKEDRIFYALDDKLQYFEENFNRDGISEVIENIDKKIEEYQSLLKKSKTSGETRKYTSVSNSLIAYKFKFQRLYGKTGPKTEWIELNCAFKNCIRIIMIINHQHIDMNDFLEDAKELLKSHADAEFERTNGFKINVELKTHFMKKRGDEEIVQIIYFTTKSTILLKSTNYEDWFDENVKDALLTRIQEFQEKDSGWTLKSIDSLDVNFYKYNPLKAGSWLPIPGKIGNKKACINIKNLYDNECFKWSILAKLHPVEMNANRINQYKKWENQLNFDGIEFPVSPSQIPKFEAQNVVSVNVYVLVKKSDNFSVIPLYLTSAKKEHHVHLLLIQSSYIDEDDEENISEENISEESNVPE